MGTSNSKAYSIHPKNADVIIIGAGPAGLSTALHLLHADPAWSERMLVIEKASHPRKKLCGGGVTRLGFHILRDLGFQLPLPLPQERVEDVRFIYGKRVIHVRGQPQFVVFHRAELDAYLAEQAQTRGVVIHEDERVERITETSRGLHVKTSQAMYRAQLVVGADGAKGVTRKYALGGRNQTVARLLEVLTPATKDAPNFAQHFATFDFNPVRQKLQGYFWDFPSWVERYPKFNRGVYDARMVPKRSRASLPRLLKSGLMKLGTNPDTIELQGHPIHLFSPNNLFSQPRILLVGDAAGADPLFGEGIYPALGYGQVASKVVQEAFVTSDFSFQGYRRRLLRSSVGRYLLTRWVIAWWVYRLCRWNGFMHLLWTGGGITAKLWPTPGSLW